MAKNIVVMSDGTGQEGGRGAPTNVYKLFNMLEDRTGNQVSFYDRGLGTGWRKVTGNVAGMGISKNILECYRFIFDHFNAGDQIFLFGFSRGATTVRSLSSFIHLFGILPKSRPELIPRAYKIYQNRDERDRLAKEFLGQHHTMWTRIRFVGVFDTVAALGLPFKSIDVIIDKIPWFRHEYQNLRLPKSVEHARQALAIDDERLTFHPKIWEEEGLEEYQTVKQVWFSGMHTDVGGGYKDPQLSDIPLAWMLSESTQQGLRLWKHHKIELAPDQDGTMHDSRGEGFAKFYRKRIRRWEPEQRRKPLVHESVTLRKLNRHNQATPAYAPWILELDHDLEPWPASLRTSGRFLQAPPD